MLQLPRGGANKRGLVVPVVSLDTLQRSVRLPTLNFAGTTTKMLLSSGSRTNKLDKNRIVAKTSRDLFVVGLVRSPMGRFVV